MVFDGNGKGNSIIVKWVVRAHKHTHTHTLVFESYKALGTAPLRLVGPAPSVRANVPKKETWMIQIVTSAYNVLELCKKSYNLNW